MFTLSEKDKERIVIWAEELPPVLRIETVWRGLSYKMTPVGLGVTVDICDNLTGKTLNLINYNEW